jgi:predicted nucleotidyltransferase
MTRTEAIERLRAVLGSLREFHVLHIAVFGSVARNEADENSDFDLLVEFDRPVGMFHFIRLQLFLEKVLGRNVDLVTPAALRPELREEVMHDAVQAA